MQTFIIDGEAVAKGRPRFTRRGHTYTPKKTADYEKHIKAELIEQQAKPFEKETPFRQSVYTQLLKIPYGKTATYRELAAMIGKPKAARAVGGALHHNPLLILVPCHRIIGSDGSLTGFAGGTDKKRFLLDLEQSNRK